MKKLFLTVLFSLLAASVFADAPICEEYFKEMETRMKQEGVYSDQAMKIVKDQIAAVPAEQHQTFCKVALETLTTDNKDPASDIEGKESEE